MARHLLLPSVLVALFAATLLPIPTANAEGQTQTVDVYLHELDAGGFHIIPEQINANVGDTLKITVHNQGVGHDNSQHDLVVCGDGPNPPPSCATKWGFTGMIQNNQTAPVTVTLQKAGTFTYYCDIPGHAQAGMAGRLVVAGAGGATPTKNSPGTALLGSLMALAAVALLRRRT